jgi:hypothetical protein
VKYNVVEPKGEDRSARDYVRIPRRDLFEILKEVAEGRWQSVVLDQKDCQQLLKRIEDEHLPTEGGSKAVGL